MSSLINSDVVPEGPSEPVDPALARFYPSLDPRTGEFRPLPRGPRQSSAGYVHPDAAREHEAEMAIVRRDEARLRAMYPSMYQAPRTKPMAPPETDEQSFGSRMYARSMPNGGVDVEPPPTAKPAPAPTRPTPPAAATSETRPPAETVSSTEPSRPEAPSPDLPEAYRDLAVEGLEIDHHALARVAPALQELAVDRRQLEGLLKIHGDLERQRDQAFADEQRQWRQVAERVLTPEDRAGLQAAMADAPQALKDWLNATGAGDFPPLVKHIASLGRKLAAAQTPADRLAARYKDWR